MSDHLAELEKRIGELLAHEAPKRRCRRYARDGFAQGVLLHHLEGQGLFHKELPVLPLFGEDPEGELYGSRFCGKSGSFEAYATSPGEALARAAHKALVGLQRRMAG